MLLIKQIMTVSPKYISVACAHLNRSYPVFLRLIITERYSKGRKLPTMYCASVSVKNTAVKVMVGKQTFWRGGGGGVSLSRNIIIVN